MTEAEAELERQIAQAQRLAAAQTDTSLQARMFGDIFDLKRKLTELRAKIGIL